MFDFLVHLGLDLAFGINGSALVAVSAFVDLGRDFAYSLENLFRNSLIVHS